MVSESKMNDQSRFLMNKKIVQMFILALFCTYNILSANTYQELGQVFFGTETKVDKAHQDFLNVYSETSALIVEEQVNEKEEKSDFPNNLFVLQNPTKQLIRNLSNIVSAHYFGIYFQKVPGFILYHNLKIPLSF
jgi:hypothetical protein